MRRLRDRMENLAQAMPSNRVSQQQTGAGQPGRADKTKQKSSPTHRTVIVP